MLVLRTLILGPLHGYGVAKAIRSSSTEALDIEFGSLYPALKRLEMKGWIVSKWETSDLNRRAKFYRLTAAGKKRLQTGTLAMARLLRPPWRESWAPDPKGKHESLEKTDISRAIDPSRGRPRHAGRARVAGRDRRHAASSGT